MKFRHERAEIENLKAVIELEKGPHHVRFVPSLSFEDGFPAVLEWPVYIMEMNQDARVDGRENVEDDVLDVAPDLQDVR